MHAGRMARHPAGRDGCVALPLDSDLWGRIIADYHHGAEVSYAIRRDDGRLEEGTRVVTGTSASNEEIGESRPGGGGFGPRRPF